ncbi:MAG: sel1 repeat family protein [Nitrospiraceae bacterium]|nr:sel1 repeat family protein [Nitrospiraceae bacterium]
MIRFSLLVPVTILCAFPACVDQPLPRYAAIEQQSPLVEHIRTRAEDGSVEDQYSLGLRYERGQGVPQDYQQAARWYRLAAMQRSSAAQYKLCTLSDIGRGLPQNYQEALRWCRLAADHGEAQAMFTLGVHYHTGLGVHPDLLQAHKWYNLAAAYGYQDGAKWRDRIARELSPARIAEAQKLAREWQPIAPPPSEFITPRPTEPNAPPQTEPIPPPPTEPIPPPQTEPIPPAQTE